MSKGSMALRQGLFAVGVALSLLVMAALVAPRFGWIRQNGVSKGRAVRSASNGSESAALRAEIDGLKAEMRTIRFSARQSTRGDTMAESKGRFTSDGGSQSLRRPRTVEEEQEYNRALAERLQSEFDAEASDPSWSRTGEQQIRTATEDPLVRQISSEVKTFSCRSSLCKIEAVHRDRDALRQWELVFRSRLNDFPLAFTRNEVGPTGETMTTTYLSRDVETFQAVTAE